MSKIFLFKSIIYQRPEQSVLKQLETFSQLDIVKLRIKLKYESYKLCNRKLNTGKTERTKPKFKLKSIVPLVLNVKHLCLLICKTRSSKQDLETVNLVDSNRRQTNTVCCWFTVAKTVGN